MNLSIIIAFALALSSGVAKQEADKAPISDVAEPKPPAGLDPKLSSDDPEYGYTRNKPIKVGSSEEFGGPTAERAYLSSLRDEVGKPVKFSRVGSVGAGADGHVLDNYMVRTSTGRTITLYIDMYHPENDPLKQLAPKGLFKAK